ncbi:MAG: ABC transporter permease [Anaerorhabdus sp.]
MNIFKRAWISIMRRKTNSIILLLIVFILANVLLITLTVTTSLKNTEQMVLKQFPPAVKIKLNYRNDDSKTMPDSTPEMAEKLYKKTNNIVNNYDYSLLTGLEKTTETKLSNLPGTEVFEDVPLDLLLKGTQVEKTNLVTKEEGKMILGNGLSESDIKEGKNKVIVSKQFAEANGLEIGTRFPLNRTIKKIFKLGDEGEVIYSEDIELEVAGIMEIFQVEEFIKKQAIEPTRSTMDIFEMEKLANTLYAPNHYVNEIIKDTRARILDKNPENPVITPEYVASKVIEPEFILNDMKDLNDFTNAAKEVYNKKYFDINSTAKEYEIVAKPLSSMERLLSIVFKVTIIASIVILTLVLCIFMYLRQKEMGIFLALGERRKNIVGQLMIETLIVALVGATLAIATSLIFSNMLSDNLLNSLMMPTKDIQNVITSSLNTNQSITPELILGQYQGGFSIMTLLVFYGTTIITIIVSQLATVLYLLRLNPKKILM